MRIKNHLTVYILVLLASCAEQEELGPSQNLGGITVQPPASWKTETPRSAMRKAQYALPAKGPGAEDASLIVYYFGPGQAGSVQANLSRWYRQVKQPDGGASKDVAKVEERMVSGMKVTMADVSGTYAPGSMGPMMSAPPPKDGYRMIAAIVESKAGAYYLKLTGPENTMGDWADSFERFVEGIITGD